MQWTGLCCIAMYILLQIMVNYNIFIHLNRFQLALKEERDSMNHSIHITTLLTQYMENWCVSCNTAFVWFSFGIRSICLLYLISTYIYQITTTISIYTFKINFHYFYCFVPFENGFVLTLIHNKQALQTNLTALQKLFLLSKIPFMTFYSVLSVPFLTLLEESGH